MPSSLLSWLLLAVLVFWAVGAYNRLVRLRAEAVSAFGELHAELLRQVEMAESLLSADAAQQQGVPSSWAALQGAAAQLRAALGTARQRPLEAERLEALDTAQAVLAAAWERAERADAHDMAGPRLPESLSAVRGQGVIQCIACAERFSRAVTAYNQAIRQFPALLLAWLFGFRPAAGLAPMSPPRPPGT